MDVKQFSLLIEVPDNVAATVAGPFTLDECRNHLHDIMRSDEVKEVFSNKLRQKYPEVEFCNESGLPIRIRTIPLITDFAAVYRTIRP